MSDLTLVSLDYPHAAATGSEDMPLQDSNMPQTDLSHDTLSSTLEKGTKPTIHVAPITPSSNAPDTRQRLALGESLGTNGLLIIIGGSIWILACVGFLSFIWFGAGTTLEAKGAPSAWRSIALNGWTPRTITLIALALRITVTAQAAVCVSALAGLILELSSVSRSKVAHFSIMRATNTGPTALMRLILSSRDFGRILRVESLLALFLLLNTLALQFSSTILLSDTYDSVVAGDKSNIQVHSYASPRQQKYTLYEHYYKTIRPIFAIYGESPMSSQSVSGDNGFDDTGIIERAFLPIRDGDKREAVRYYEGDAIAFSYRTSCVRPDIRDIEIVVYVWEEHATSFFGRLNGTLDYGSSITKTGLDSECGSKNCPPIPFSCFLPGAAEGYGWQSAFCFVGGVGGALWPPGEGPGGAPIDNPWPVNSSIYLVLSNNMATTDWDEADRLGILNNGSQIASTAIDYKEWRSYELMPGRFLNASLCFQSYNLELSSVRMVAKGEVEEPKFAYDLDTGGINTDAVQRYIGVDPSHTRPDERGILEIEEMHTVPPEGQDESQNITLRQVGMSIYEELVMSPYSNVTFLGCYHCSAGPVSISHIDLSTLVANTLNATLRAANVVQVYTFSVAMMVYYQYLQTFTEPETVTISSTDKVTTALNCRQHGGCSGFISVVTLLGVHIIIVLVTTILFVTRTRFSKYSNVWCAISQLTSNELYDVVEKSSGLSDNTVAKVMEKEGKDYTVRIGTLPGTTGVGVIRHEES
ncbi:hypothetical protein F5Y08DRAFT_355776 [Xylaria arbuscula]|nr:hypothetical protein F5Y08DRAFT_355776 [Xylaria arbuscula]